MGEEQGAIQGYTERVSRWEMELNSCGRQVLTDADYERIREKGRADYHILYIVSGCCYVTEQGRQLCAPAGSMILYRPHERQQYAFRAGEGSVSCYLHFSGSRCEEVLTELGFGGERIVPVGVSQRLEGIFSAMEEEFVLKKPQWQWICDGLLRQFLATAARKRSLAVPKGAFSATNMDTVCSYIYSHYRENRPIAFYAQMCHLSEGRFSHAFRECVGMSPKQYILDVKLTVAKGLLSATAMSVQEIADAVGMEDAAYFSRIMKRRTSRSPLFYRR